MAIPKSDFHRVPFYLYSMPQGTPKAQLRNNSARSQSWFINLPVSEPDGLGVNFREFGRNVKLIIFYAILQEYRFLFNKDFKS